MNNLKRLGIFVGLMCLLVACSSNKEEQINKPELWHVWYSEKQLNVSEIINQRINQAILEDSAFVIYTEMTRTEKPSGIWDDYVYLGKGNWHKVLSNSHRY